MRHTYGSPKRMTIRAKNDAEAVRMLRRVGKLWIVFNYYEEDSNNFLYHDVSIKN